MTKLDAYPLPQIDDILDTIGQANFITTLDLAKGYWQVMVAESDRSKTAFISPLGLFQFKTMPFGLCGAPATFQCLIDQVIQGSQPFTRAYLDDVVIFSNTWEEHLTHLCQVFQRLTDAGLTIKLKKCQFAMEECVYLGHVIGKGRIQPEEHKTAAIRNYPRPLTKKQVHAFLGLTSYYRRFLPDYAGRAKPLTDLTQKHLPDSVVWTSECDTAFEDLKGALSSQPVLHNPDFQLPFLFASDYAVGAVLSQVDAEGLEHPVSFFSRKLLPRETRYATIEKECLTVKLGVQHFAVYLTGRPFSVQTDHRVLMWLNTMQEQNGQLTC